MADPKRLALFLDGTWNTVDDDTNVWRLKSLCSVNADQFCYYSAGVGTVFGQRAIGGMFGWGLDDEVIRAYQWLIENYASGDRIFLFGFSRGAYTARSLSGFISKCGLLKPGSPISLRQLYKRYQRGGTARTIRELKELDKSELTFEDKWLIEYSLPIPIWFQGVWDTVGALGVPLGRFPLISRANYDFLEVDLRINETRAYHALALDEHRPDFAPTLWTKIVEDGASTYAPRPISDVEQRWFIGAHADVGGGYENGILAQVPLKWLKDKAELHGLRFNDSVLIDGDEKLGPVHDSFAAMAHGFYRVLRLGRPLNRLIGADPVVADRAIKSTINETIDISVFDRWRSDSKYRPANLSEWASRRAADIGSIHKSVCANHPNDSIALDPIQPLGG